MSEKESALEKEKLPTLLMVGQTPPPYHGQAVATGILFEHRWSRFHVRCLRMEYSKTGDEVGKAGFGKVVSLVRLVWRTWKVLRNHGDTVMYYLPASPNLVPVLRDILYLSAVRPFTAGTIYHFHAGGLADYLSSKPLLGRIARWAYGRPRLSIEIAESAAGAGAFLGAENMEIIRNGLEVPAPGEKRPREDGLLTGLFVGALRESKGIIDLVRTARALVDRKIPVRFELAGVWVSDGERERFESEVEKNGLGECVTVLGELRGEDKWKAFQRADFFFFPSFYESENFPLVLIEALGSALPVVASRWRGIPELVNDGEDGFLCETGDVSGFADAIEILARSPEKRVAIAQRARAAYLQQYTKEIFCGEMEDAFMKVLKNGARQRQ